jgi:hypothetical protein
VGGPSSGISACVDVRADLDPAPVLRVPGSAAGRPLRPETRAGMVGRRFWGYRVDVWLLFGRSGVERRVRKHVS